MEIEVLHREQREKKSALANRYQFDFVFKRSRVFQDCQFILRDYIKGALSLSADEDEKVFQIIDEFIPTFFFLNDVEETQIEEPMEIDSSEQVVAEEDKVHKRTSYTFYANTNLYAFFRLYQMMFSRLLKMFQLSEELKSVSPRSEVVNDVAVELGYQKEASKAFTSDDRYTELLILIQSFLKNQMEAQDFEDKTREIYWTSGYLIFTIDKLAQTLVKQVSSTNLDPSCCWGFKINGTDWNL
jgi:histone deacetylase complex regulatory component SIN3